jgi:D-alanyl-lipoteichoic acid acyltransferase DltB (MBOAT superfamily)
MEITSLSFAIFVTGVVLLFHLVPSRAYKSSILTVANIIFIMTYIDNLRDVLPLFAFLLLGYITIGSIRRYRSNISAFIGISVVVTTYIYLKKISFLHNIYFPFLHNIYTVQFPYLVVGLSYILFRILHLIIDIRAGDIIEPVKPLAFFNYTCNFTSFISGPIQLYHDFKQLPYYGKEGLTADFVFDASRRIISGYSKVLVVSAMANYLFMVSKDRVLAPDLAPSVGQRVIEYGFCAIMFTTYLYYNFAGYMDIVIGVGRLLGQNLPENFNKPFSARNFLEFWTRWHITLSQWFKAYLFNPLMKLTMNRFEEPAMVPYLGVTAFFITFFVMGIWHGTTAVFAIYGFVMGAGASINKLWQLMMVDRLGRQGYRALSEEPLYIYTCRGLTCSFFAIGITCLWVNMDQLRWLWGALGPAGVVSTVLLLAVVSGIAMFLQDLVLVRSRRWFAWATVLSQRGAPGNFCSAARILLILMVSTFFHKTPEFVYRAF